MEFLVAGATGFLGGALVAALQRDGHRVQILSRDPRKAGSLGVPALAWDDEPAWRRAVAAADVVVNLTGESIAGARWNPEVKRRLEASRIEPARKLADAAPKVLLQASATGYYGAHGDDWIEESAPPGDDFLARLCEAWEDAASGAESRETRLVRLRIGQVLGRGGGMLESYLHPPMLPFSPFQWGLGGPLGDRMAWLPWIHLDDVVGLMLRCARDPAARGPVNLVAPNPARQQEFAAALGRALHRPALVPVPTFALKLLLGEFGQYLSTSQRVRPAAAQALGYPFRFPELDAALADLLQKR